MSRPGPTEQPPGPAPDGPRPPAGADAWDERSEAVLAGAASGLAAPPLRKGARGSADPVRALMHRHRELCERAVDPLEIAAGLEAHGITDRTAARFRHRDVFALADELYARVPRSAEAGHPVDEPAAAHEVAPHAPLFGLLPGGCAVATAVGIPLVHGGGRLAVAAAGALVTGAALLLTLRRGPLRAEGRAVPGARGYVCWLLGYALCGDGLLDQLLRGGPDGTWPLAAAPLAAARLVGLALAVAPAVWCARLLSLLARRGLAASRGTAEFAARARPLVVAVAVLYAAAPALLLSVRGFAPGAAALAVLLFLARLLTVHGFPGGAATALGAACTVEALALASVLAGRLPGCRFLAVPVDALGVPAVSALACGAAALALLVHATGALSRASAHT
ncbi:hypothetical protein OG204_25165 [Streptomyces sp. NBC_01387]|uniref:hypothetical protein n=1 Tax=unclassified Streptomyces TaxID=2593676 RepID=UPI00225A7A3D|nr:hypothetical protein [Streptomyces sp. NBC_01500]MCX4548385.1 hypothetical protein [Streptomyces sp. NBC_01500]